jgi:hypothetical protein
MGEWCRWNRRDGDGVRILYIQYIQQRDTHVDVDAAATKEQPSFLTDIIFIKGIAPSNHPHVGVVVVVMMISRALLLVLLVC